MKDYIRFWMLLGPSSEAMDRVSAASSMIIALGAFTFASTGIYGRGIRSGIMTAVANKTTSLVQSNVPSEISTGLSVNVA